MLHSFISLAVAFGFKYSESVCPCVCIETGKHSYEHTMYVYGLDADDSYALEQLFPSATTYTEAQSKYALTIVEELIDYSTSDGICLVCWPSECECEGLHTEVDMGKYVPDGQGLMSVSCFDGDTLVGISATMVMDNM